MLGSFSLGTVGLLVGSLLTVVGVVAYATGNATLNLAGFFYGVPLLLGGLALKAAELKPVPYRELPTAEVIAARSQATPTQTQIRKDVTRYRYGQEAHLDSTLASLGLSPSEDERPVLVAIAEVLRNGAYTLILEFDSPAVPLEVWQSKQLKMETFFGPGVAVAIEALGDNRVQVALIRHSVVTGVTVQQDS
ncbi:DUF2854 domain-containing protein [Synechococcus sp. PCC 6717]|nr:DUF2854 domain-containing protein [Synechococcus sp. PCC 6717]